METAGNAKTIHCDRNPLNLSQAIDLNLPQAIWNGDAEKASGLEAFVNNLVWENGYTQVVSCPTRGHAMLDNYVLRPESSLIACNIFTGISDHSGVLLEVEWDENRRAPKAERIVPVYYKTDAIGLQTFLREKFELCTGNGSCMQEIWNSYKGYNFRGYQTLFTQKRNPDPEYYNRE
jgi:hypothetical protein